jgi:hypothetical protein
MILLDIENREALIEAWKSNEPAAAIAEQLGLTEKDVLNAWRRLKSKGHLPPGDRPYSRQSHYARESHGGDGRPRDNGDMLDALNRAHPERIKRDEG